MTRADLNGSTSPLAASVIAKLDAGRTDATEQADNVIIREAGLAQQYIRRRIESGTNFVQAAQGLAMALAEEVGIRIVDSEHDDFITAIILLMGQQVARSRQHKAERLAEMAGETEAEPEGLRPAKQE